VEGGNSGEGSSFEKKRKAVGESSGVGEGGEREIRREKFLRKSPVGARRRRKKKSKNRNVKQEELGKTASKRRSE